MESGVRLKFGLTDPYTYVCLGSYVTLGKRAPPLPTNQHVSLSPHPANYVSPWAKGLDALAARTLPCPETVSVPHIGKAQSLPWEDTTNKGCVHDNRFADLQFFTALARRMKFLH